MVIIGNDKQEMRTIKLHSSNLERASFAAAFSLFAPGAAPKR